MSVSHQRSGARCVRAGGGRGLRWDRDDRGLAGLHQAELLARDLLDVLVGLQVLLQRLQLAGTSLAATRISALSASSCRLSWWPLMALPANVNRKYTTISAATPITTLSRSQLGKVIMHLFLNRNPNTTLIRGAIHTTPGSADRLSTVREMAGVVRRENGRPSPAKSTMLIAATSCFSRRKCARSRPSARVSRQRITKLCVTATTVSRGCAAAIRCTALQRAVRDLHQRFAAGERVLRAGLAEPAFDARRGTARGCPDTSGRPARRRPSRSGRPRSSRRCRAARRSPPRSERRAAAGWRRPRRWSRRTARCASASAWRRPVSFSGTSSRPRAMASRLWSVWPCRTMIRRTSSSRARRRAGRRCTTAGTSSISSCLRWTRVGSGSPSASTTWSARAVLSCSARSRHRQPERVAGLAQEPHIEHQRPQVVRAHLRLAPVLGRDASSTTSRHSIARRTSSSLRSSGRHVDLVLRPAQRRLHRRRADADLADFERLRCPAGTCRRCAPRASAGSTRLCEEDVDDLAVGSRALRQRRGERDLRARAACPPSTTTSSPASLAAVSQASTMSRCRRPRPSGVSR